MKSTDIDKQIIYIGVIKHAESRSGLIFSIGPFYDCYY